TAGAHPQVIEFHAPGAHAPRLPPKTANEAAHIGIPKPDTPIGEHHKADKIHPLVRCIQAKFVRMDAQAEVLHILPHALTLCLEHGTVVTKEKKVIHIAEVALYPQLMLHKEVKRMQVNVGKELAGQVADGQTARTVYDAEEISRIRPFLPNA